MNPTLGVITLILSLALRRAGNPPRWAQLPLVLVCVAVVYALGYLDSQLRVWPSLGLDFSGHTGVHVAIVVSLWMIDRRLGLAGVVIAVLYAALMLYQKYHSVADILTTAVVIAPASYGIWYAARRLFARPA